MKAKFNKCLQQDNQCQNHLTNCLTVIANDIVQISTYWLLKKSLVNAQNI